MPISTDIKIFADNIKHVSSEKTDIIYIKREISMIIKGKSDIFRFRKLCNVRRRIVL